MLLAATEEAPKLEAVVADKTVETKAAAVVRRSSAAGVSRLVIY
jgi:hypothetical protein